MSEQQPVVRRWAWWVGGAVALLVATEVFCRLVLGLGTPPLYETHPGYEYRLQPHQDVKRFGNHIVVNRWGMRSVDFEATKTHAQEWRLMVYGDSVVNGGSQIDQSKLSTSLLQTALSDHLKRPVVVGNVSAGSWGPGNWLAYAKEHGFMQADAVVLVLGSGDHADNPVFAPLDANHPGERPVLAIQEALSRYLPQYLPKVWPFAPSSHATDAPDSGPSEAESARGLQDLEAFLNLARQDGRVVAVVHHPDRQETLSGGYIDGYRQIRELVLRMGLPFVDLMPTFQKTGSALYRDGIHHTPLGQKAMADALAPVVTDLLRAPSPANKAQP